MLYRSIFIVIGVFSLFMSSLVVAEKLQLTIETAQGAKRGVVTIGLLADKAPNHVERIKRLTKEGLYNGVAFHRVISGFMAQTGDVEYGNSKKFDERRAGTGSSPYKDLQAEFSDIPFTAGVVGMARSNRIHSANSQFFIMTDAHSSLNGSYTVVGFVVDGLDVARGIQKGSQSSNGKVAQPDIIKQAMIIE